MDKRLMLTEKGEELPKAYNPQAVESRWYDFWLEQGYFTPKIDLSRPPFTIIMPPPNVTGELHLGHALTATLEDIMVRWHRMRGEPTLWLPGRDHAGIAAQVVVERDLAKEGLTRQQLGREKFLERMWTWMEKYGRVIAQQHQKLGASCDWIREHFTLDPRPSQAVRTAFVRLYHKGLIYRGERIINWCPRCATALSDLEVDHREIWGNLWYVRYPLADGQGFIIVATTRPETILGDTAVAVNPQDARYQGWLDKMVILPVVQRVIPIIADEAVDQAFGTGAVKITPAHDPVDFEVAQRHGLPSVNILNPNATMNANAGPYQGQDRYTCRRELVSYLESQRLLVKVEPHRHAVGHCQRCGTVVEPWASKQWFVRTTPLAIPAIQAVTEGHIKIIPERFAKVYLNWLENIRDWCISRQLWWGHRIPVWYCAHCDGDNIILTLSGQSRSGPYGMLAIPPILREAGTLQELLSSSGTQKWTKERLKDIEQRVETAKIDINTKQIVPNLNKLIEDPTSCPHCGQTYLFQDPDVLDTWFSSALWPHSTLGWPDETEDFKYFYPTSVMETGYDILFFWVARMVMMGLEDAGQVPFRVVFLHGLIRDEQGEKMSKLKGNVLNPLELAQKYGTDALRFAISTGTSPGNDIRLSSSRLEASRNFVNKLWNAARFVLRSLEAYRSHLSTSVSLSVEDRWILSRLHSLVQKVSHLMEEYQFGEAERQIHDFLWGEYCDWYIEMAKLRLQPVAPGETSPLPTLINVLETTLRLLHPFMPFVTEEIWQSLYSRLGQPLPTPSIMVAPYPVADTRALDPASEEEMEAVIEVVRSIRNARAELKLEPERWLEARVYTHRNSQTLAHHAPVIENLARVRPLTFQGQAETRPVVANALVLVLPKAEVVLPLEGVLDLDKERGRLETEIVECQGEISRLEARLQDKAFLSKAPEAIVDRERERLAGHQERLARLRRLRAQLG